ncbi:hypothetical protein [Spirosoma jeollabukense]
MNSYPAHFKRLFSFVALLTLVYASVEIVLENDFWNIKNLLHFLPFVAVSLYYRFGFFYHPIDFDAHFFYRKNRKDKIPLSSIQSIKLTWLANQHHDRYWKVTYLSDELESVRVLPSTIDDSFARFIEAVKEANPSVDTDIFEFKLYFGFLPGVFWKPNKS